METARNTITSLIEKDQACIWHPFTQMQTARAAIPIVRAKGIYLYGEDGSQYLDGISSWWVNLHGHAHPYIVEKIKAQAELLEHVIFADFTHAPAVELASRLLAILPGAMSKIFYSDNGSTAVEIALKMALQYWHNQKIPKTKVICFKNSYHGDTFGAMSAAGRNEYNRPFWQHLFDVVQIDPPLKGQEDESLSQLQAILTKDEAACFIFEPLVLGAGGMIIYPSQGLSRLIQCCKQHKVLTIADEVMTGFGRTGSLFACEQINLDSAVQDTKAIQDLESESLLVGAEHSQKVKAAPTKSDYGSRGCVDLASSTAESRINEKPDLICLSKGLTGGFLPLGVTACTADIFNAFLSDHLHQAFLHGHSYTANPLACSSALASLDLLLEDRCTLQREMIAKCHKDFCQKWQLHPKLKRCESLGTILALEYQAQGASYSQPLRNRLYHFFLSKGILLRPLGNVLYVLPPYCIRAEELTFIYDQIIYTLEGAI